MQTELLHPADQIVLMMERIYRNRLTTTSGGNLSILDANGDIWITPSGIDKGSLTRQDICCVKSDGTIESIHKPSVELPIHSEIYQKRSNIKAVLHAHPPSLVAFSAVGQLPDINLLCGTRLIVKNITMAKYAVPGSGELQKYVSLAFESGSNVVLMENHGVVVGASDMFSAYKVFETLVTLSGIEINAKKLGNTKSLTQSDIALSDTDEHLKMSDFLPSTHSSGECAARRDMVNLIQRACRQKLFTSTFGTFSQRLSDGSILITPHNVDRAYIQESDLVLIRNDEKEKGKLPSRYVMLHKEIYDKNEDITSIINACPACAMAFAVTDAKLDSRTIPESYIILRNVKKVNFNELYFDRQMISKLFSDKTSTLICGNSQILVTGNTPIQAFDRLEVMEATANSIILANGIGKIKHISQQEIEDIEKAFNL